MVLLMKISFLLKELIVIAKKQKTDFALHMNMTPSGLSKILTEKGIPTIKDRKIFTKLAAEYFAQNIYSPGCYWKFENIFPVIYDFESQDDLQSFLSYAIEYALDGAFTEEININLDYSERGQYYIGKRPVLGILCIILSDYATSNSNNPLEIYFSIPLLDPSYTKIFQKMVLIGKDGFKNIIFNFFYNKNFLNQLEQKNPGTISFGSILSLIVKYQKYFQINLWETSQDTSPFLLLKSNILMFFNAQIDGTPILTAVYNKSYLAVFYNILMKRDARKISYEKKEIITFLENNPDFFDKLTNKKLKSVYNFTSFGYMLTNEELDTLNGDKTLRDNIKKLFDDAMSKNTSYSVSNTSMDKFISMGKVIVPFIGTYYFPPDKRIPYLQRFDSYLEEGSYNKLKIINSDLSNMVIFCFEEFSLAYVISDTYEREIMHLFRTNKINDILYDEMIKNSELSMDFSTELWNAYQQELIDHIP